MPYSFTGYSIFLASEKGYFKEQGLDVTLKASYPD
jgi:ABC-type nitrate/sulfonate/bicarbonate transport system substrate-binding protein